MRQEIALRRVVRRREPSGRHTDQTRTEAFKWAWEKLEGWGSGDPWEKFGLDKRTEMARGMAWNAIKTPLWTPNEAKKRWHDAEA